MKNATCTPPDFTTWMMECRGLNISEAGGLLVYEILSLVHFVTSIFQIIEADVLVHSSITCFVGWIL